MIELCNSLDSSKSTGNISFSVTFELQSFPRKSELGKKKKRFEIRRHFPCFHSDTFQRTRCQARIKRPEEGLRTKAWEIVPDLTACVSSGAFVLGLQLEKTSQLSFCAMEKDTMAFWSLALCRCTCGLSFSGIFLSKYKR